MSHLDYDGLKEVCNGLKRHSDDSYSIVLNEHNKLNKTVNTLKNTVDCSTKRYKRIIIQIRLFFLRYRVVRDMFYNIFEIVKLIVPKYVFII